MKPSGQKKRRFRCATVGFAAALVVSFLLLTIPLFSSALSQSPATNSGWQSFERMVRDGYMSFVEGEKAVTEWAERLEKDFPESGFPKTIFFPLPGYSLKDVGGKNGEGYKPKGYRFLDGNRHGGHPAQDIFIQDHNQDGRDDLTRNPVKVLALASGIVLSVFDQWDKDGPCRHIRGGNYVWIYHPALKAFSYYAHLDKILVRPENRVEGGQPIAVLGRSGKNAFLPRSPTHLHLMLLSSGDMQPMNPYPLFKPSASK